MAADITTRNQGQVEDSGKVNWRGDQVSTPQGGQSIYDTSSLQLTDLGSRKVVGDRVFRYALANGAAGAGDLCQSDPAFVLGVTGGTADPAGGKTFTFYFATSNSADVYAEGYLHCQSGTAANLGYTYRIKSQPIVADTSECSLELYDPLKKLVNVTDEWSVHQNLYRGVKENVDAAGTAAPVGVAPILVASGEYFWLQTWGPAGVKSLSGAPGEMLTPAATGQVGVEVHSSAGGNVLAAVSYGLQVMTASEYGMVFLTIAP